MEAESLNPDEEVAGRVCKVLQNLLVLAVGLIGAACGNSDSGLTSTEAMDRESVREYLLVHPEIVLDDPEISDAIRRARLSREQDRAAVARRTVLETHADLLTSPLTPSSGDVGSTVMLIEFFDYQCLPCKASNPDLNQVRAATEDLRIVYGQLPIYGSHSIMAARAAIAAHRQGRFDAFHDALMNSNTRLDMDSIYATAAEVGLDLEKLRDDMRDPVVLEYLEEVRLLAEALGVTGTPAFIIGDAAPSGGMAADELSAEIARQRAQSDRALSQ